MLFAKAFPYQFRKRDHMENKAYQNLLTERERVIAFNEGLKCSVYILESASCLSSEGIKFMVEEIERQISESEIRYTEYFLELIRKTN